MNKEMVEHPEHYKLNVEVEVLDIIELLVENIQGKKAFIVGNVIKYLLRAEKKNGLEDLKKARFYLEMIMFNYYRNLDGMIEREIILKIGSILEKDLENCFCQVCKHNFIIAYELLDKYIKDKENEQRTEKKTESEK